MAVMGVWSLAVLVVGIFLIMYIRSLPYFLPPWYLRFRKAWFQRYPTVGPARLRVVAPTLTEEYSESFIDGEVEAVERKYNRALFTTTYGTFGDETLYAHQVWVAVEDLEWVPPSV